MINKKFVGYIILLVGIFCSFIFIASENEEYVKLKKLEKKIKEEIYENIQEHKKNLYEIEKHKIENNKSSTVLDI